jgi:hypothetical protein
MRRWTDYLRAAVTKKTRNLCKALIRKPDGMCDFEDKKSDGRIILK